MKALVLAHEPDGPAGQIEVRLAERGFTVHTHIVTSDFAKPMDAAPFPNFDGYDLLLPMGSVRSLTNKAEIDTWIHEELDLLKAAHHAGKPILGVCFGAQMMADALGGSVEVSPAPEIGWFEISAIDGVENPIGPGPWMEWHHDRFTPPPGAEVLARTDEAIQLFRIGHTVGTQFHPEVDVAHVARFLETAPDEYLAQNGVSRATLLAGVHEHTEANTKQCHALVDWFLDEVAFR